MTAGIKANSDGSGAIQVGGTDYITISSTGAVAIPVSLTVAGQPAGGNYALNAYVAPATWTKPTGLKAVKVTVVGAGGNGGAVNPAPTNVNAAAGGGGAGGGTIDYIPAPSIPGPVAVTAGPGTNSFGAFCSATAGSAGTTVSGNSPVPLYPSNFGDGGAGGSGSGGNINITGGTGQFGHAYAQIQPAGPVFGAGGAGADAVFGFGTGGAAPRVGNNNGANGVGLGSGGSGGTKTLSGGASGGVGTPGIVIIEEFY